MKQNGLSTEVRFYTGYVKKITKQTPETFPKQGWESASCDDHAGHDLLHVCTITATAGQDIRLNWLRNQQSAARYHIKQE